MEPETKMTTKELSDAVRHLLEREEGREDAQRRRDRQKERQRRREIEAGVRQLARSIEVIKWCLISITSVMAIALLTMLLVVMEVQREAEHIKGEVQEIQQEAELIRDRIQNEAEKIRERLRHPLEYLGGNLGRQLEQAIGNRLGAGSNE